VDIRLVTDPADAAEALADITDPIVGVDVERSDGGRYFRGAALVQVGAGERCVALDPLAMADLSPLARFLRPRLAVLHAIENDLDPLDDEAVILAGDGEDAHEHVADTAIAAALLGLPTGLDTLLAEVLGVELTGDKERFQRADWTQRPLGDAMLAYAAGDVVHLPGLWAALDARLDDAARPGWYEQELAETVTTSREQERSWRRTRGAGRLDGHGRAVLRELWEQREAIARDEDVAPQLVARDDALVELASDPPDSMGVLSRSGLRGRQVRAYGQRLLDAARRGSSRPDEPSLTGLRRATDEDRAAQNRMRKARARVAREVGIDPGVLCPSRVLTDAVLSDPEEPEELCDAAGLRPWQRELLRDELWDAFRGA
jgi:ribonuclease D